MYINEMFGPTFQGEGRFCGRITNFLRLAGCNLRCSFCDTSYTWDYVKYNKNEEIKEVSVEDILYWFVGLKQKSLVITGGEPLLQVKELVKLISILPSETYIEIETAGTFYSSELANLGVYFNVSPKLSNSGNSVYSRFKKNVLLTYNDLENSMFKFVIKNEEDMNEVNQMVTELGINRNKVWIMPEGYTKVNQLNCMEYVSSLALKNGYNFSPRLHVLIWDTKRGV